MFKYISKTFKENFRFKVILAFALTLMLAIAFDRLTKYFLFDTSNIYTDGGSVNDLTVFGIRSQPHFNSTIFSAANIEMDLWAHYLLSFGLAGLFTIPVFFSKNILLGISLGFIVSGVLGNGTDKLFSEASGQVAEGHYVMDIFYIPWFDKGTFNLADTFIVIGAVLLIINLIIDIVKEVKEEKAKDSSTNKKELSAPKYEVKKVAPIGITKIKVKKTKAKKQVKNK